MNKPAARRPLPYALDRACMVAAGIGTLAIPALAAYLWGQGRWPGLLGGLMCPIYVAATMLFVGLLRAHDSPTDWAVVARIWARPDLCEQYHIDRTGTSPWAADDLRKLMRPAGDPPDTGRSDLLGQEIAIVRRELREEASRRRTERTPGAAAFLLTAAAVGAAAGWHRNMPLLLAAVLIAVAAVAFLLGPAPEDAWGLLTLWYRSGGPLRAVRVGSLGVVLAALSSGFILLTSVLLLVIIYELFTRGAWLGLLGGLLVPSSIAGLLLFALRSDPALRPPGRAAYSVAAGCLLLAEAGGVLAGWHADATRLPGSVLFVLAAAAILRYPPRRR